MRNWKGFSKWSWKGDSKTKGAVMGDWVFKADRFQFLEHYEVHFAKDEEGFFLYEVEDLNTLFTVDSNQGLTEEELVGAVGSALSLSEYSEFQKRVHSMA